MPFFLLFSLFFFALSIALTIVLSLALTFALFALFFICADYCTSFCAGFRALFALSFALYFALTITLAFALTVARQPLTATDSDYRAPVFRFSALQGKLVSTFSLLEKGRLAWFSSVQIGIDMLALFHGLRYWKDSFFYLPSDV